MARAKKKTSGVKVNFKGVESRRTPPEGDYLCKVLTAEQNESSKGNDQSQFVCEIAEGEYKGSKLYLYCPHGEASLWKLHAFLTSLGVDVPEDEMELDYDDYVDREFMGVVGHDSYQGKKQAKLVDFDVAEAYEGAKSDKKSKKKDKDAGKDKKADKKGKKDEPEEKAKDKKGGKDKDKKSDAKADKKSGKDDKGKKDKKPKVPKIDGDDVKDGDAKSWKKLIKEHDLNVDLDDYKTDKKKVAAIISALEDKDLLAD